MFSFLALGFAFFAKTDLVRSSCNYFNLDGVPLAVTTECLTMASNSSYNSSCISSTTVEAYHYPTSNCTGTPVKETYTGSDAHCGGDTCYAKLQVGLSCSQFFGTIYFPFDTCLVLDSTNVKVTCSSYANYSSTTCAASDIGISYPVGECYTTDDVTILISDGTGYCTSGSTTTSSPGTTSDTGSSCNYFESEGVPLAVTSKCTQSGSVSFNSKCITSTIAEVSNYDNTDCSGDASSKTNYTASCGGSTCYAETRFGNSCSNFSNTAYVAFDVCFEANGTYTKITCDGVSNYTSDSCSTVSYSYSLDKCHINSDGSAGYVKDATGYCSMANGLNTNIFRSIIAILFVVYLFR